MGERVVLHVDMDAFFASVEVRDDPSLAGRPVIVGGASRRGVVAAASYEARRFGVRSAMSMVEALTRCPRAVVVPPRHARYAEVSRRVFEVFLGYTPLVEGLSLDEAFLDVGASRALFGGGVEIAERIRRDIRAETGLTASAGVARSKFVAKIASDINKPDGITAVPEDVARFLSPLPIERMWGVGAKTAPKLHALGLRTFGDLQRCDPATLQRRLGAWGARIAALSRGDDDRPVVPDRDAKSVGSEETFELDLSGADEILEALIPHAERVAARLLRAGRAGRTVSLKLKHHDHRVISRQTTLAEAASDAGTLIDAARAMLARLSLGGARFRLVGLSVSELAAPGEQPALFPDAGRARRLEVERALLGINERFGDGAVFRAGGRRPPERG
ncbi:MAG: DNA polymerase IV [Polyangiaceae bacterium]|nr:DNA polymerase IV [Polyangiaceae bacterium]